MTRSITVETNFHFQRQGRGGRKNMRSGDAPVALAPPAGRVPRVARFMALAIRFDGLIRAGEVADYAELARLSHVSRARITQIMNLLMLAPAIQEAILFLPRVDHARDPIYLFQLQPICIVADWRKQKRLWDTLV